MARDCPSPVICSNCEGIGHIADDCRSPHMCYNCREENHYSWECRHPKFCRHCSGPLHLASSCSNAQERAYCLKCGGMYHCAWQCIIPSQSTRDYVETKSWSSRPVHSPTAAPAKGQSALKGLSLCPNLGLFGVGPTKQGHTKDGFKVTTSIASSTNQSTSELQNSISLMALDA